MAYTKLYEKLAKAWGCDCESNTEYGALKAIAENPPFGTKTEMVEIVAKKTFEPGMNVGGVYETIVALDIFLEIGKKYKVILNDTEYFVECFDDNGYPTIGQPSDGTGFTKYPFALYNSPGQNALQMSKGTDSGGTIALYEVQETVKQLDPKFVGGADLVIECTGGYFDGSEGDDTNAEYQINKEMFDKCVLKAKNGEPLNVVLINKFVYGDVPFCASFYTSRVKWLSGEPNTLIFGFIGYSHCINLRVTDGEYETKFYLS